MIIIEDRQTLFCFSKVSCAREMSSSKFIDNLGTRVQKGSPAVLGTMRGLMISFMLWPAGKSSWHV
jgi:hypothetical protein